MESKIVVSSNTLHLVKIMFESSMYLLSHCQDLLRLFARHFARKSMISLVFNTLMSSTIMILFMVSRILSLAVLKSSFIHIIVSPIVSLICASTQNTFLRICVSLAATMSLTPIPFSLSLNSQHLNFLITSYLFFAATSPSRNGGVATYQKRSKSSIVRVATLNLVTPFNVILITIVFFVRKTEFILPLFLRLTYCFTEPLLSQLLTERITELDNQNILVAACLTLSCYLGERYEQNLTYARAILNKQSAKQLFSTRFDSFAILQIASSIQRAVLTQKDVQVYELQKAAKQLMSTLTKRAHVFTADETVTANLVYLDVIFCAVFDAGARLFGTQQNVESLQKVVTQFDRILRPELLNQLQVQQTEEQELNFVERNEDYGLNLNNDGTDVIGQDPKAEFGTHQFKQMKISKFTILKALLMGRLTIDDIVSGQQQSKLMQFEEQQLRARTIQQKKLSLGIWNIITFQWARQFIKQQQSVTEDISVLRGIIGAFVEILMKIRENDGFPQSKLTVFELLGYLQHSGAERRIPEVALAAHVARACLE